MATVTLIFADGERFSFAAGANETVLAAARRNGLPLASDCEHGECQACRGLLRAGAVVYPGLVAPASTAGDLAVLCCIAEPRADLTIELPYRRSSLLPVKACYLSVTGVERLCDSAVVLRGTLMRNAKLAFYAGQYANLTVPGTTCQRAYSMANSPDEPSSLEFLVRLIDGGAMSEFLRSNPAPGTVIALKGPHGAFYRRERSAPILMIAGGTGLAPMLSMLRQLAARGGTAHRITLCFGATAPGDVFGLGALDALACALPRLERRVAVMRPDAAWMGARGLVTELLDPADVAAMPDAYLCGPPAMVAAARTWLNAQGLSRAQIFSEEFVSTGG